MFFITACSSEGPVAPANMGLAVRQSPSGEWISRQETTISWKVDSRFANMFESFIVYYSINLGDEWLQINEVQKRSSINWVIPSGINSNDCLIKVVGCSSASVPIVEVVDKSFSIIPFGDIDHFVVDVPSEVSTEEIFDVSVVAGDRHDNIVLDYNKSPLTLLVAGCVHGLYDVV